MTRPSHIFIVGLSRTGTTLTRRILNCADEVGIGGESQFFGDRRRLGLLRREGYRDRFAQLGDLHTDEGAKRVVDSIFTIKQNNFWGKIARGADYEQFLNQVLASDRSERALLDIAMSFFADGKPIHGEKTPAHIYAVPTLLQWYPNAKIIHTFRDPRAVYISNKRKYEKRQLPFLSVKLRRTKMVFEGYASLDVMLNWRRVIRLHRKYQRHYPNQYYLSRYEDLIATPRASVEQLCAFLGIPFQEEMLNQMVLNSSFLPKNSLPGFDTQAIYRWRDHLNPQINRWFVFWCGRQLQEFGYQP
ncbi:MAG TPA: sulfotransferase [Anaerolineae bacterium]|nr:sulfotransferase [Anaerolineae bacterium]